MKKIALIFAAGKGSRLKPFTDTTPKPLAPITPSETILDRHMRLLSPYIDRFIIVTNYLEEQIHSHIGATYNSIPVNYVHQDNPKGGTGDCLRVGLFGQDIQPEDQIFITNADEVLSTSLYLEIGSSLNKGEDFLIGQKLEDRERLKQFGIIQLRPDGKIYDRIIEKPQVYVSDLVNIGMYCVSGKILAYIPDSKPDYLSPEQEEYIFIALDAYAKNAQLSVIQTTDWLTVSSLADLDSVQGFLSENPKF